MSKEPIWRILHQCALKLTKAGKVPFTRADLIACVRQTKPDAMENSINPIIQGITDNLKGGAHGADGKRILHSVGRGKFVLLNVHQQIAKVSSVNSMRCLRKQVIPSVGVRLPTSENELRDTILSLLKEQLLNTECVAEPEGRVSYVLPSGNELSHSSDILVSIPNSKKRVSIEIKYKSAVTDQFKCRAFDAMHMKSHHGDTLLTVMLYAKTGKGISIEQARRICYSFDRFYGALAAQFLTADGIEELTTDIRQFIFSNLDHDI